MNAESAKRMKAEKSAKRKTRKKRPLGKTKGKGPAGKQGWEGEEGPTYDYVLPLRDVVVFPGMVVPLFVGRPRSTAAIDVVTEESYPLLAITQRDPLVDDPMPEDLYTVGTLCNVLQTMRLPDGSYKVLLEGLSRKIVIEYAESEGPNTPFMARSLPVPDIYKATKETEARIRYIRDLFEDYVRLFKKIPKENLLAVMSIDDPSILADQVAAHLNVKTETKQKLLAASTVEERLNLLGYYLEEEIDILEVEKKIKGEVRNQIDKSQREYYLTEQIKAIQRELGRDGEALDEIEEYREKLIATHLTKEAFQRAEKELTRLSTMAPMSPEATVVRTYLDWIVDLPWDKKSDEILDLDEAEKVLEKDHYGLEKPKERILEFLAVRKLNPNTKGPILCFVGPPGVGKTSLGKSIARATHREFARISLGGMRDEAEIRGHRRTYIGSMPGRILQTLRKVKTNNPVILLDEIDKMNSDFRGDPASALLEVLDPEQNKHFSDNYLELEFDLSQVFFITTANVLHTIPPALRDRMEVIEISSYTEHEKIQIAKRYLAPRAITENGLKRRQITFKQDAFIRLIRQYTREAGVRNLEREIHSVCRKVARRFACGEVDANSKVTVDAEEVRRLLGIPKFTDMDEKKPEPDIGTAIGLAWTQVGGDILHIEVSILDGKGDLVLTGQLGDVMQESAKTALSYTRSRGEEYGLPPDFHKRYDIHIHLPEGAIPKDGPSAGVTLATALISALSGMPVRTDVAMTGEITLRGKVLPVGGIKEKLLAAHRNGIYEICIPQENEKDLEEIPRTILKKLKIHLVSQVQEILDIAIDHRRKR